MLGTTHIRATSEGASSVLLPYPIKCLHDAASINLEIVGILFRKFVLELGTGCCVHHVIHKQAVDNEMLSLALRMEIVFPLCSAG